MREKALRLLGLMRRANAISVGELNTAACARGGKAKLLLLAADASDNARDRAEGLARGRGAPLVTLPFTKAEFSSAVGLAGGSMAAITDLGFANALLGQLAAGEPERYAQAAAEMETRWNAARRKEPAREKRIGKRRMNG